MRDFASAHASRRGAGAAPAAVGLALATALLLALPAFAALPGPPLAGAEAVGREQAPCTFARCAPRRGATWGAVAGFGGAVAVCGWVGRRRR